MPRWGISVRSFNSFCCLRYYAVRFEGSGKRGTSADDLRWSVTTRWPGTLLFEAKVQAWQQSTPRPVQRPPGKREYPSAEAPRTERGNKGKHQEECNSVRFPSVSALSAPLPRKAKRSLLKTIEEAIKKDKEEGVGEGEQVVQGEE